MSTGSRAGTAAVWLPGLLFVLVSVGCTHHYVPKQVPIEKERVGQFPVPEPVTLTNVQESTEPVLIGAQGIHKFCGDLHAWTETAIGNLRSELEKRGMPSGSGDGKQLSLAVRDVDIHWGFATIRCITDMTFVTGDGYRAHFEGNAASGVTLYKACRVSVTRALALNDPEILAYLKGENRRAGR